MRYLALRSPAKLAREAQEGGGCRGSEGGSLQKWQESVRIFKVIFQGIFFGKKN